MLGFYRFSDDNPFSRWFAHCCSSCHFHGKPAQFDQVVKALLGRQCIMALHALQLKVSFFSVYIYFSQGLLFYIGTSKCFFLQS